MTKEALLDTVAGARKTTTTKEVLDTVVHDVSEGAKRAAVLQVTRTLKTTFAVAFAKAKSNGKRIPKAKVQEYEKFLESDFGDLMFKLSLGSILPMLPKGALGPLAPHIEYLCQELRVQGAAQAITLGTDMILAPLKESVLGLLTDDSFSAALRQLPTPPPRAVPSAVEASEAFVASEKTSST